MKELWDKEYDILNSTSSHKFRTSEDVSQFIFRYWDMASGSFNPVKGDTLGQYYGLGDNDYDQVSEIVCDAIQKSMHKMICINDCFESYENFELAKVKINNALNGLLSEKSSFEI
jgi:hypothetical protein